MALPRRPLPKPRSALAATVARAADAVVSGVLQGAATGLLRAAMAGGPMVPASGDPLTQLVKGLREDGRPPLDWAIRWSVDGKEPVAAAWEVSSDAQAMLELIDDDEALLGKVVVSLLKQDVSIGRTQAGVYTLTGVGTSTKRNAVARTIRAAAEEPPSLQKLIDRYAERA